MPMQDVIDLIVANKGKRIALTAHSRPDGDAIGSVIGLARILEAAGYSAQPVNITPVPERLAFLAEEMDLGPFPSPDWISRFDCLIVMDCGEWSRVDAINRAAEGTDLAVATIDHHASSEGIGEAVWIEPTASSVGEMTVNLALAAGWEIPPAAAEALWTAIVTDTGRFTQENASADALAAARECLLRGAEPAKVADHVYHSVTRKERFLESRALARTQYFEDGQLAVTWLTRQDFIDADCGTECAQDMINLLRDTGGVKIALFLCDFVPPPGAEAPIGVKGSVRTVKPYDAIALVSEYGGGGHHRAAGCTINLPMDTARRHFVESAQRIFFNRKTGSSTRV